MINLSLGTNSHHPGPVKRCSRCGNDPRATVQAGGGRTLFWLDCRVCGTKTADGQVFAEAVKQWNEWNALR
jgi:hypothetical protein